MSINPWIGTLNHKYKNFTSGIVNNLGPSVLIEKPPLVSHANSLEAQFQGAQQRFETLTIDQPISIALAFNSEQLVENNINEYMSRWGEAAVNRAGSVIGNNLARHALTDTYRFFGDGRTPITTRLQLMQMKAQFENYGSAAGTAKGYISDLMVPSIIGSDLNQFVGARNDKEAASWELTPSYDTNWYKTNILATHFAGTEGQNANNLLTITAVETQADGGIIGLVCSGTTSANDVDCIKENDKLYFVDNVAGFPVNMRYLVWDTPIVSGNPVQMRATANAPAVSSSVTIPIFPPLYATNDNNANINQQVQAGMKVKVIGSRQCGLLTAGDPFYLAMPPLMDQDPFSTSVARSKDGMSMRLTKGSRGPGSNFQGFVWDGIWGGKLMAEYGMEICIPLS